jgi:general secretion pathway protein G
MDCQETASTGPYRDILSVRRAELGQLLEEARELNERLETVADDVRRLSRPVVRARRWRAFVWWGERILWAFVFSVPAAIFGCLIRGEMTLLNHAKAQATQQYARKVKDAAEVYFQTGPFEGGCPTVKDLVTDKQLAAFAADDAWGTPFRIECADGEIHVYSNGADKRPGTADDIRDDFSPSDLSRLIEQ